MTAPDDSDGFSTPFGPDDSTIIPGELLLVLSSAAAATATQTLSTSVTSEDGTSTPPTAFGVPAIDSVLTNLRTRQVEKLHDEVDTQATVSENGETVADPVAAALDATYLVHYDPAISPSDAVAAFTDVAAVSSAEPNYYSWLCATTPNDTDWAQQWGPVAIHCPDAWDTQTGSNTVAVAIVDSGIDPGHPDLAGNLLTGRNFVNVGADPLGWQYVGRKTLSGANDTNAADEVGHGTHVAGIVGAIGNNGQGVAGVVWSCHLLPVRVMARVVKTDGSGATTGMGTSANIAAGIRWAADQPGVKVINLSIGSRQSSSAQTNAVTYAINKGILVVAAMGNENTSVPSYPAAISGVLAVGAIDKNDQRWVGTPGHGSNTGAHIGLVAPGAVVYNTYYDYPTTTSTYRNLTGTSMASPHVAGVAAMLFSAAPAKTAADVKAALLSTARRLPSNTDPLQVGAGCVDCVAALRAVVPPPQVISGPDPESQPTPTDPTAVASTSTGQAPSTDPTTPTTPPADGSSTPDPNAAGTSGGTPDPQFA